MNEEDEDKEISVNRISAYCPTCKELNHYEIRGLFTEKDKKQTVNPVLNCRYCNQEFWISVTNIKEPPKIFFNFEDIE